MSKKTITEFKQDVFDLVGDEYEVLGRKLIMKHNTCGYEFTVNPSDFINGYRCPQCNEEIASVEKKKIIKKNSNTSIISSNTTSNTIKFKKTKAKYINEIAEFIRSLSAKLNVETNVSGIIPNDVLDIYVPKNKLAIEFVSLYENCELCKPDKKYHLNKKEAAKENGIRLILIYEDCWRYKNHLIKEKIKYILNRNRGKHRIDLDKDKYVIKEITPAMKNKFLNLYHVQGKDTCQISLGLFIKSPITNKATLVSVMTFVRPRFDHKLDENPIDYELSRFASTSNYVISKSFSKMLKYFEDNFEWNTLSTYADYDWSDADVYLKTGWTWKWMAPIAYYYADLQDEVRCNRQKFQKHKLQKQFPDIYKDSLSEKEIMLATHRYYRIYDCGNIKLLFHRKEKTK